MVKVKKQKSIELNVICEDILPKKSIEPNRRNVQELSQCMPGVLLKKIYNASTLTYTVPLILSWNNKENTLEGRNAFSLPGNGILSLNYVHGWSLVPRSLPHLAFKANICCVWVHQKKTQNASLFRRTSHKLCREKKLLFF